eukprot:366545-Chlamydomonas_euryale.AAC.11
MGVAWTAVDLMWGVMHAGLATRLQARPQSDPPTTLSAECSVLLVMNTCTLLNQATVCGPPFLIVPMSVQVPCPL